MYFRFGALFRRLIMCSDCSNFFWKNIICDFNIYRYKKKSDGKQTLTYSTFTYSRRSTVGCKICKFFTSCTRGKFLSEVNGLIQTNVCYIPDANISDQDQISFKFVLKFIINKI